MDKENKEQIKDKEHKDKLIPSYQLLNYENKCIEFKRYFEINRLFILKRDEQYWLNIANKLAGNQINIENYIDKIQLINPLSPYFQFKKDIQQHVDEIKEKSKENNIKVNKNKLYSKYWDKLKPETQEKYSKNYKKLKLKYDLDRLIIKKFFLFYFDPIGYYVSEPYDIFATTMSIYIKSNKMKNKENSFKYVPYFRMINYFQNMYKEIKDEKNPLYPIKQKCIENYNYLTKLFETENEYNFEFVKDIKKGIVKEFKEVTALDLFKEDIIKSKYTTFIPLAEEIFKMLDKNIILLYKRKAKKQNLLSEYRIKLLEYNESDY